MTEFHQSLDANAEPTFTKDMPTPWPKPTKMQIMQVAMFMRTQKQFDPNAPDYWERMAELAINQANAISYSQSNPGESVTVIG